MNNQYTYWAEFSFELDGYVARSVEFPALVWVGTSAEKAIKGIVALVDDALAAMVESGEHPPEPVGDLEDYFAGHRRGDRTNHLLDVMRTEIWPLLPIQPPITKTEREQILGYAPEFGDVTGDSCVETDLAPQETAAEALILLDAGYAQLASELALDADETAGAWIKKLLADPTRAMRVTTIRARLRQIDRAQGSQRALMPRWNVAVVNARAVVVCSPAGVIHWLSPDEARVLGLSLRIAALEAVNRQMADEAVPNQHDEVPCNCARFRRCVSGVSEPARIRRRRSGRCYRV